MADALCWIWLAGARSWELVRLRWFTIWPVLTKGTCKLKWLRLSEQDFRFDRWSICRD